MVFNLKKVLRALIFSTNQPLSVKDIQAAFTRFHERAALHPKEVDDIAPDETGGTPPAASPEAILPEGISIPSLAVDAAEDAATAGADNPLTLVPENPELYQDVPSLITATQIREALAEIAAELKAADPGLQLIEGSGGFQLVTDPQYAHWVRLLRNEPSPVKLSQSALETLAVIAYRQPATRTEIEHIRGVSAEAGVNKLLERELIYIVGRADLPGRPLQYGTTDRFLEFVGIKSLDELPASDVLSNRQIDEWLQKNTNAKPPADEEMGLPLEMGEGESPNFERVSVDQKVDASLPEPEPAQTPESAPVDSSASSPA
ncbi:MAG: SMC-Scp complex subunit ScpB [Opitutaceae bacterium]|jgi:segregation and condensation protein B